MKTIKRMKLMKHVKNQYGFEEHICVLQGSEEYLTSKLDIMSDRDVVAFYITE